MTGKIDELLHSVADALSILPVVKRIPTEDGNFIEQITRVLWRSG
jgi:hypothetical protein